MMTRRTDTEDLPVLARGVLTPPPPKSPWNVLIWIAILAIIGAVILSLTGCEKRVQPKVSLMGGEWSDPLIAYLVYGVLFGILGVGVGVALLIWGPFKKTAIAVCGGSLAIVGMCLTVRSILPYIGWIVLAVTAIGAVMLLWQSRKLLGFLHQSWEHVPDEAQTPPKLDAFMSRLASKGSP